MNGNRCFTRVHPADTVHQRFAGHILEQITLRSGLNGAVNIFITVEGCKHDDASVLILLSDFFDSADAVELRHPQIEKRHVGAMLLPQIDRFATIRGFAEYRHVRFASHQRNHTFPYDSVVVGDQNADARYFRRGLVGSARFAGRTTDRSVATAFANRFLLGPHARTVLTAWKPSFLLGLDS